ncbi:hypothetical protein, partial [Stenotrophomonas maltophilia]|uniref:hypothetical protein n=1 Tax=Stenotrophomonas maltophilia TaxID=40324 RepID=UPI0019537AA9
ASIFGAAGWEYVSLPSTTVACLHKKPTRARTVAAKKPQITSRDAGKPSKVWEEWRVSGNNAAHGIVAFGAYFWRFRARVFDWNV